MLGDVEDDQPQFGLVGPFGVEGYFVSIEDDMLQSIVLLHLLEIVGEGCGDLVVGGFLEPVFIQERAKVLSLHAGQVDSFIRGLAYDFVQCEYVAGMGILSESLFEEG